MPYFIVEFIFIDRSDWFTSFCVLLCYSLYIIFYCTSWPVHSMFFICCR